MDQGLFTLFLPDALRPKRARRYALNEAGWCPSEAWQRRAWPFLVATRRERGESRATRRCPPSQGPSLGVVTRLDWRGFHPVRTGKNRVNRPSSTEVLALNAPAGTALRTRGSLVRPVRRQSRL